MTRAHTPSGVAISRVLSSAGDPLHAELRTGGYFRDGTHDHYRSGTSVHVIEDKDGTCHRSIPMSAEWTTICEGVQVTHTYPDPNDRNTGVWHVLVRRDVAPVYVHILSLEESWCDDSGFGDDTSRSESYVYAVAIDADAA